MPQRSYHTKPKKKHSAATIVATIAFICSFILTAVLGYFVYQDYATHKYARETYSDLASSYTQPVQIFVPDIQEKTADQSSDIASEPLIDDAPLYPEREIDWYGLKAVNKDYIGWLYFSFYGKTEDDCFTLDYPIVYENYANQYLRTTFEGERNNAGCIFMDMYSNPSFYGYSDIIYGHHMRDDSMFGALEKVHEMDDLDWLKENPQFLYIYTKTACHKYALVAYEQVNSSSDIAYGVANEDETYDQLKENIQSLDTYMPSDNFNWRGRPEILNLSTCDGPAGTSKRFILHFVKVMAYEY